jgi:hypothetical protein
MTKGELRANTKKEKCKYFKYLFMFKKSFSLKEIINNKKVYGIKSAKKYNIFPTKTILLIFLYLKTIIHKTQIFTLKT